MDLEPFKLDIDELINEFAEGGFTKLAELKKIWVSRKFPFIFEASPTTNQACFMQSLFAHSTGYMVAEGSISHRLGGLYCLYCLFETQPFKPPFKIYLFLGELKRLKILIADAKQQDIKVVCTLVKHMLQRNMFLFGSVDLKDGSTERLNELIAVQNARVQVAYENYAAAKEQAIREAGEVIDVTNIKHTAENTQLIGEEKTAEDWNAAKQFFYRQTGINRSGFEEQEGYRPSKQQKHNDSSNDNENGNFMSREGYENINEQESNEYDDDFGLELEEALLSLPYENEDEEPRDNELSS